MSKIFPIGRVCPPHFYAALLGMTNELCRDWRNSKHRILSDRAQDLFGLFGAYNSEGVPGCLPIYFVRAG